MNTTIRNLGLLAVCSVAAAWATAQQPEEGPGPRRPRGGFGPPGEGRGGHGLFQPGGEGRERPAPPGMGPRRPFLFELLDRNNDHILDEQEIEDASKALKKLDKNGDGKIEPREIFPDAPPPRGEVEEGGRRGPPEGGERRGPRGPEGERPRRRGGDAPFPPNEGRQN